MRSSVRWTVVVVVLAVAGIVALWPREGDTLPPTASDDATDPAVATTLNALDVVPVTPHDGGERGDLAAVVGEGPALVNLWATWCGPCVDELPVLDEYAAGQDAVPVFGVQVQSDRDAGRRMLDELGVGFPTVHEDGDQLRRLVRAPVMPTSFVVDAAGDIHRVEPPRAFASVDEVEQAVRSYLGGGR
ncbi:TlpA family protein disulfide reductase [Actinoalloteichus sp. AHMU CJ021]|uniref:Thiol-disulfide isomerase or thioredoxin n=1 Tax=Actinoalloteichus caeruleus DSM 43889 TaxID=1120930 RepID=A0ABT1JLW6_ACTCY|nr:TlpA disulfide reductase family protein [Actinoalloteichus caeruleus]AUS78599.1 TlpA family protein disulfide reductase [Actinoalloteichus sp. AHMU CJ021]MCP2332726.1 Thiol-disulfide isomerase or thioredoxin [Actinoalloteichus caeruleus DSM 43889]